MIVIFVFQFLFLSYFINEPFASESIINFLEKCKRKSFNCDKIKDLYTLLNFYPIWNERRIGELKMLIEKSKYEGLEPNNFRIDFSESNIEKELKLTTRCCNIFSMNSK